MGTVDGVVVYLRDHAGLAYRSVPEEDDFYLLEHLYNWKLIGWKFVQILNKKTRLLKIQLLNLYLQIAKIL